MPAVDLPTLGNFILSAVLVAAAYTFAVSIVAARGRPRLLPAARAGTYATVALVFAAVFLLAYAFQAHDFRVRYIARYSDRSMSPLYLWTALWGGQDGSLLWWSFLLSGYTLAFTLWIRKSYLELQGYAFATLMTIFAFFATLMLFAANPFSTSFATAAPADGEGLNPLLQNYWMAIHPPSLYMGLTGWSIPFALCMSALLTGRLGDEWILAARRWVLIAWGFLSLGNMLGMFWSYEELGWGGYWAWDPVENASFMPWLLGNAYLHSVMIQERRGMLKVWNVSLLTGTFFFTIFGTFLTRSGLIASVHSFARSDIGIYFAWYMLFLAIAIVTVIAWRLPELRGRLLDGEVLFDGSIASLFLRLPVVLVLGWYLYLVERVRQRVDPYRPRAEHRVGDMESVLSREFAFLLNNWILVGMLLFVLITTTYPLISEALTGNTVTVGPGFYHWMVPLGLVLLFLMGVGPLIAWRKASGRNLGEAFKVPTAAGSITFLLHVFAGRSVGVSPVIESPAIYETATGDALAFVVGCSPPFASGIATFVVAAIAQEFWRGASVRMRNAKESFPKALLEVTLRARRRYGGYIVHLGVVLMFLGFLGAGYDTEREGTVRVGESLTVGDYRFEYIGSRTEEDINKEALYADLRVMRGDREIGIVSPAKFVYRTHPNMPTTEVAIRTTPEADLYVILSTVDPESGRATLRVLHRPLVWWIWFGGLVVLLGVALAASPSARELVSSPSRARAGALTAAALVLLFVGAPSVHAQSDSTSTLHAGTVEIHDPTERQLFERLLCQCGDCQRLPLSTCGCGWAESMRAEVRAELAAGATIVDIQRDFRERFGPQALAIPSDDGLGRAIWAVPLALLVVALPSLVLIGRRWEQRARAKLAAEESDVATEAPSEYDQAIDRELRDLDD